MPDTHATCYLCSDPPVAVASFGPVIALAYCAKHKELVTNIVAVMIGRMLGHDVGLGEEEE